MTILLSSYRKILVLVFILYSVVQIYCINKLSINYDEGLFSAYGASLLKLQGDKNVKLYDSKLPITALNMAPRVGEQIIHPNLKKNWNQAQKDIVRGRYVSLIIAILLGVLIFAWSEKIYGEKTAFFTVMIYLLCPSFLAHGIFVSSDIFACFFMTLSLYFLWMFVKHARPKHFILMSLATSMAEISKFSMVHLFLIIPLLIISNFLFTKNGRPKQIRIRNILLYTATFLFINGLIICGAHLFFQVFVPIRDYTFRSEIFKNIQNLVSSFYPNFPVPLPSSYLKSMDAVIYFDHLGGGVPGSLNGAPYILGQSSVHGFWYYYFVALFFKTPLSTLILWTAALALVFLKFSRNLFFKNELFFILPSLYFLVYMNFFYSTQVGIRHILIIFPLLFLVAGKIISQFINGKKQFFLYSLLGYQTISVLLYFPHFLPYTNEFIANKKLAYKKIADTNLCYGEGETFLQEYLSRNPDAIYMPSKPRAGKIVLEVNEMLNLNIATMHKYDWGQLLDPIDHIHSQYLIFNISQHTADSLQKMYP